MSLSADADRPWRTLRHVDRRLLKDARLQAHSAVQWLAHAARSYISPLPDDAHTNLGWDDGADGFVTHPLQDGSWLSLNIVSLTLSLHDNRRALPFSLHGRTDAQLRRWLGEQLVTRGMDANALDRPSPYAIPDHQPVEGAAYDAVDVSDGLTELAAWFANAERLLEAICVRARAGKLEASDVRCWPHHFDIATLISFPARDGQTGYVGAGLSPGDGYYDEPYFYVSVYPKPDPVALPELPESSHWHTHEFTAAIVPAHRILALKDAQSETMKLLKTAVDHAINLLA
jgi:hypothetical protein